MFRFARPFVNEPLRIAGILWPLALLTPFAPGLPRPHNGGLTWRQEGAVALLLCATFALLRRHALKRRQQGAPDGPKPQTRGGVDAGVDSFALSPVVLLGAFVLWGAASALWAANVFPAIHYGLTWTLYLLFFLTLRRAVAGPRLLRASLALLGTVVVVMSASNVIGYYGSPDSLIRQHGLGEPVAVSIPLFAALALTVRRARAALLCGAAATLGWLSMLQIAERAPFIGVGVGLTLLAAAMLSRAPFRPRSRRRLFALVAAFAACMALQAIPSPFAESRHQTVFVRLKGTSTVEANTRARFLYWATALEMWRARPLAGVGAGGYDAAFPEARASFAAKSPDSPLVEVNEKCRSVGAHNEYLQIMAELGAVGLALFVCFAAACVWVAWCALRRSSNPLAPGAVASLAVFAVSSGASSVSFRWAGSGLIFFFAVALVMRFAGAARREQDQAIAPPALELQLTRLLSRRVYALGLAATLLILSAMFVQATNVMLLAGAQASADPARADRLYRSALVLNPLDQATHFNYGLWLFYMGREHEALPRLRFAVERGFHTSTCYAYLAAAESNAGELEAAERTLAEAVRVYPRSVFLRVRHAAALGRLNRHAERELEMSAALLLDSRLARGWQQLIDNDMDAAIVAAKSDPGVALPGQLQPDDAVFVVLKENEKRFPEAVTSGWRAQKRRSIARP